MFQQLEFESVRLITKPLDKKDAEALFKIYSDQDAMKYRGSDPMKNMDDASKMILEQKKKNTQNSKIRLGLWNKLNNNLVGTLLLNNEKFENKCEIGFSFGKKYWGIGLGCETLKMVEQVLIQVESIEHISAWCIKENIASVKIFQKAGYHKIEQSEFPKSNLFEKKIENNTTMLSKISNQTI